ncbi:MAG: hypothetical protein A2275_18165 [Bacteroidetes bacterium RIFOXYA12_FULL_35_11]|nr:MAG: hypothetical protein A2X01_06955 [Bacteroidetes bacterium GWF2_35_48]OFY72960.1 MAG: hypothetical protein A2275_18165 [Bacteroidetes bacterium RIFOXYA12_FULL_35_11]OFY97790.1 MAG: hypothetical protein A2309_08570 [Bacteroidetes bacterium RIFOXYB2_FULL_35_7]HBX53125.1 hypothetical protein [Bacteroidales bacterium]
MLKVLIPAIVLLILAFLGFAIKMFFIKNGEFKKTCSSVDSKTGKRIGCVCNGEDDENCVNYEEHHGKN